MSDEQLVPKGLDGVVVDKTQMSMVDGINGVLVYRGYNIDEVADCSFEEICHLFLEGELPNRSQLTEMQERLNKQRRVPDSILKYIESAPIHENPMGTLRSAVSMLSGYMDRVDDVAGDALKENSIALISQVA